MSVPAAPARRGCAASGCQQPAVCLVRSYGMALCKEHFLRNVEERVGRTLVKYKMEPAAPASERWVVAMSGGKDSQCLAEILCRRYPQGDPQTRVSLVGLYVDVHVEGNSYTADSRRCVEETCARLGMQCHVVDILKDGLTMDDIHVLSRCKKNARRTECSACGVVKRYQINRVSAELKADKVATGHHLTDESTTLLGNFLNMNVELLTRSQPWERKEVTGGAALLPRVKPFFEITEEETTMYVRLAGLTHVATQCPYAVDATSSALKKHMLTIERDRPGSMLRLVRGFHKSLLPSIRGKIGAAPPVTAQTDKVSAMGDEEEPKQQQAEAAAAPERGDVEDAVALNACGKCGAPTVVPVCAYCKLVEQMAAFKTGNAALFAKDGPREHKCHICRPDERVPGDVDAGRNDVEGRQENRGGGRGRFNKRQRQQDGAPENAASAAPPPAVEPN